MLRATARRPPTRRSTSTIANSTTPIRISTAAMSFSGISWMNCLSARARNGCPDVSATVNRIIGGWEAPVYGRLTSGRPFTVYSGTNTLSSVNPVHGQLQWMQPRRGHAFPRFRIRTDLVLQPGAARRSSPRRAPDSSATPDAISSSARTISSWTPSVEAHPDQRALQAGDPRRCDQPDQLRHVQRADHGHHQHPVRPHPQLGEQQFAQGAVSREDPLLSTVISEVRHRIPGAGRYACGELMRTYLASVAGDLLLRRTAD